MQSEEKRDIRRIFWRYQRAPLYCPILHFSLPPAVSFHQENKDPPRSPAITYATPKDCVRTRQPPILNLERVDPPLSTRSSLVGWNIDTTFALDPSLQRATTPHSKVAPFPYHHGIRIQDCRALLLLSLLIPGFSIIFGRRLPLRGPPALWRPSPKSLRPITII